MFQVSEISGAASKELSIEESIAAIAAVWEEMRLEIVPYKDREHFILRGTDDVFQFLEDHQVGRGVFSRMLFRVVFGLHFPDLFLPVGIRLDLSFSKRAEQ